MRRIAATLAMSISMATIFFVAPANAKPLCGEPLARACDRLCNWGIVC